MAQTYKVFATVGGQVIKEPLQIEADHLIPSGEFITLNAEGPGVVAVFPKDSVVGVVAEKNLVSSR